MTYEEFKAEMDKADPNDWGKVPPGVVLAGVRNGWFDRYDREKAAGDAPTRGDEPKPLSSKRPPQQ